MQRRAAALVLKGDMVLMVKLKDQDRLMPRATWVFPFVDISEDDSPRREVNNLLSSLGIDYSMTNEVFKYSPSENPKLLYLLYVTKYNGRDPEVGHLFQTYKWVSVSDITAYSTSFMDGNVSKYLEKIKRSTNGTD
ncbi:hypothetical protein M1293_02450 [Candidatus Parvarchaeota archaeon]|nr:hypothetical protein [Candidatus Parvarchaeota archaeon]